MKKIGILTDTSSGFNAEEAQKYGIELIYMPVIIDDKDYLDTIDINGNLLFNLVSQGKKPKTSQPSCGVLMSKFSEMLAIYEKIIYIPLSSSLSSTMQTAIQVAVEFGNKIRILDTQKVSYLMRQDVLFAKKLVDQGYDVEYIAKEVEKRKGKDYIILVPENLIYLKMGGRISSFAYTFGNFIGIKPLIKFENGSLSKYAQARTFKKAHSMMIEVVKNAGINANEYDLIVLYSSDNDYTKEFYQLIKKDFPNFLINYIEIPVNVSVHTGPNAIGLAYCLKI